MSTWLPIRRWSAISSMHVRAMLLLCRPFEWMTQICKGGAGGIRNVIRLVNKTKSSFETLLILDLNGIQILERRCHGSPPPASRREKWKGIVEAKQTPFIPMTGLLRTLSRSVDVDWVAGPAKSSGVPNELLMVPKGNSKMQGNIPLLLGGGNKCASIDIAHLVEEMYT